MRCTDFGYCRRRVMISMLSIVLGGLSMTRFVLMLAMLDKGPAYRILTGDSIRGWTAVRLGRGLALRLSLNGLKASGGMLEWCNPYARRWKKWI
jgi:hypothetical protein